MEYIVTRLSIPQKVLNENTGELETKYFHEEAKKKTIRGGFNMIYHKNYEDVMEKVVSSNKELRLFNWIINQFTYMKTEVSLSYLDVNFISRPQFIKMIKTLVELQCLKRVKRGIYRLNPFMYLPFRADGEELQAEWNQLQEHNNDK